MNSHQLLQLATAFNKNFSIIPDQMFNLMVNWIHILEQSPASTIQHVKANGPVKLQRKWKREQWGNIYADRIAKGLDEDWATTHIRWPVPELETLTLSISKWHWINQDRHLLLEPISSLIQRKTLDIYLIDRDIYRVTRGDSEK